MCLKYLCDFDYGNRKGMFYKTKLDWAIFLFCVFINQLFKAVRRESKYAIKLRNCVINASKFVSVNTNIYFLIHCRICNSTLEMCWNNSKSGDSISKMKTNTFNTHSNIDNVIVFVVCVFVLIMIGIIGSAFYKRQSKKNGNFNIY